MVINVGAGVVVVPLKFGTYFGACFRCNGFDHFARSCPILAKQGNPKEAGEKVKETSSLEVTTAGRANGNLNR